jgi:hypothetical protein
MEKLTTEDLLIGLLAPENWEDEYIYLLSNSLPNNEKVREQIINKTDSVFRFLKSEYYFLLRSTHFTTLDRFEHFLKENKDFSNLFRLKIIREVYGDSVEELHSSLKLKAILLIKKTFNDGNVTKGYISNNKPLFFLTLDPLWGQEPLLKEEYRILLKKVKSKEYTHLKKNLKLPTFSFYDGFVKISEDNTQRLHSYYLWFSGLFPNCKSPKTLESTYLDRFPEKFPKKKKFFHSIKKNPDEEIDYIQRRYYIASLQLLDRLVEQAISKEENKVHLAALVNQLILHEDKKHKQRNFSRTEEMKWLKKYCLDLFNIN